MEVYGRMRTLLTNKLTHLRIQSGDHRVNAAFCFFCNFAENIDVGDGFLDPGEEITSSASIRFLFRLTSIFDIVFGWMFRTIGIRFCPQSWIRLRLFSDCILTAIRVLRCFFIRYQEVRRPRNKTG